MKRLCLALATVALAASATMTAPSATASEAVQLVPSGSALIRIDGDRAIARQVSGGRYFIVMPAGVEAGWIGAAVGVDGVSSGRFGARTLVESWAGLGHRGKTGVLTTLTWTAASGQESTLARVSDPRMNADGRLVFTARTPRGLPRVLEDFSVNISGAPQVGSTVRSTTFPFVGNALGISGTTVSLNATATSENTVDYIISGTSCPAGVPAQWTSSLGPSTYGVTFSGNICGVTFTTSDGTADGAASAMMYHPKVARAGYNDASTEFWIMTSTGVSTTFTWDFMQWG